MMQEFILPASAGKARRLVELAKITRVSMHEAIRDLAREGLADFTAHPSLTEAHQGAVQRLLDCDLRGVLLYDHEEDARQTLFAAAQIAGVRPIVICTRSPRRWWTDAERLGLSVDINPNEQPDVLMVDRTTLLRQDVIEPRRDGLLIIEQCDRNLSLGMTSNRFGAAREFARTVVISDFRPMTAVFHSWTRQCDLVLQDLLEELWPSQALAVLNPTQNRGSYLRERNFLRVRPAELYPLFNVVFDLLGEKVPR